MIPAADEERRIDGCLQAVADATASVRHRHPEIAVSVVVALDGCHDRTGRIAAARGARMISLDTRAVGAARAAGCGVAIAEWRAPAERLWIANTDADSRVPADWLLTMARLAAGGSHAALGTVVPDDDLARGDALLWRDRHDLTDGHRHVHGANFGIRADVYAALGGWAPLSCHEDVDLAERCASAGYRVARFGDSPVTTSSRITARAPGGFADYLRVLGGTLPRPCVLGE